MPRPKLLVDKTEIIKSAFRIVHEEGESALTARKIAKEMNIAPMTLYNYADNIEAIKKDVVSEGFNLLYSTVFASFHAADGGIPPDRSAYWRALAGSMYDFAHDYPNIYQMIFSVSNKRYRDDIELRHFYGLFGHAGAGSGPDPERGDEMARQILEQTVQGVLLESISGIKKHERAAFDELVDFILQRLFCER